MASHAHDTVTEHRQLPLAEIKALKDKGNMLVKAGRHSEAIGVYKHAIVVFLNKKHQNDDDADSKLTFAQCHLNMALCLLHLKTPANIIEAVICCDAAIELLQLPDQATSLGAQRHTIARGKRSSCPVICQQPWRPLLPQLLHHPTMKRFVRRWPS
jgi:hypothetical protein